jgi:hypothetical protein
VAKAPRSIRWLKPSASGSSTRGDKQRADVRCNLPHAPRPRSCARQRPCCSGISASFVRASTASRRACCSTGDGGCPGRPRGGADRRRGDRGRQGAPPQGAIRERKRLLGGKTLEVEILTEALSTARAKNRCCRAVARSGRFPMKAVADTLEVAGSNLAEEAQRGAGAGSDRRTTRPATPSCRRACALVARSSYGYGGSPRFRTARPKRRVRGLQRDSPASRPRDALASPVPQGAPTRRLSGPTLAHASAGAPQSQNSVGPKADLRCR